jgi:hypothetical protein
LAQAFPNLIASGRRACPRCQIESDPLLRPSDFTHSA